MSSLIKKKRLNNNIVSTIFKNKNAKDEKQCIGLINILNSCMPSNNMNEYLLKEIAEYATGILIKCNSTTHSGWIHHLYGNNFDADKQYENNLSLFTYKCDDEKCVDEVYIFECQKCDERSHINRYQSDKTPICTRRDIYPYRVCWFKNCVGIYCPKCCLNSGVHCWDCGKYVCNKCIKYSGGYCQECVKYYCKDCLVEDEDEDEDEDDDVRPKIIKYCGICKWRMQIDTL